MRVMGYCRKIREGVLAMLTLPHWGVPGSCRLHRIQHGHPEPPRPADICRPLPEPLLGPGLPASCLPLGSSPESHLERDAGADTISHQMPALQG